MSLSITSVFRGPRKVLLEIPAVMAVLVLMIVLFANAYWISTLTSALAIALASRGIGLLYGQLGLVSLCQFALLGVGGWMTLRISHGFELPFEITILIAGIVSASVGAVWGAPALRMKGLYLALITLMLAGTYQTIITSTGFPDGGEGFLGRADATQRLMIERPAMAESDHAYFVYVAVWVTLGFLLTEWMRISRPGRSWALIRKGEQAAQSAGVNLFIYKLMAFAVAGFLAGAGGALLAGSIGQLDGRAFPASESLFLFALSVVAGVYNWYGALIAGLLMRAVPSLLIDFEVNGYVAIIIYGVALLHALMTAPAGIAGQIAGLLTKLKKKPTPETATSRMSQSEELQ